MPGTKEVGWEWMGGRRIHYDPGARERGVVLGRPQNGTKDPTVAPSQLEQILAFILAIPVCREEHPAKRFAHTVKPVSQSLPLSPFLFPSLCPSLSLSVFRFFCCTSRRGEEIRVPNFRCAVLCQHSFLKKGADRADRTWAPSRAVGDPLVQASFGESAVAGLTDSLAG